MFCIGRLYQHVFPKLYFATAKLPEDFWAFSFELTNSRLFQQNLMPALHYNDVTSDVLLVLMLS